MYVGHCVEDFLVVKEKKVEEKKEKGKLLFLPDGPTYRYYRRHISEPSFPSSHGAGVKLYQICHAEKLVEKRKEARGVWPVSIETMFYDLETVDRLEENIERAKLLGNIYPDEFCRVKTIMVHQRIAHEIINEVLEKYPHDKEERVPVIARRCSGIFTPNTKEEGLLFAIVCFIAQYQYHQTPYQGQRVSKVEFDGWDMLVELMKERRIIR